MKTHSKALDEQQRKIGRYIRARILEKGENVRSVVDKVNAMFGDRQEHYQTTSNQINAATLPFWKVMRIAEAIGYDLKWERKQGNWRE